MQQICNNCGLTAADGNLWCHRSECSLAHVRQVLRRGDRIGDFEIEKQLGYLRTATLYIAQRGRQRVLLKIAHADQRADYVGYLKREADLFRRLTVNKRLHQALPIWLPPDPIHPDADAYGKVDFRGTLLYYSVFEYVDGVLLRDVLNDNPQPPVREVAWWIIILSDVLNFLAQLLKNYRHEALAPECILIYEDGNGIRRPMLLDLGLYNFEGRGENWRHAYSHLAYTAPEIFQGYESRTADAYGLGLLMYEMFAGRHPLDYKTRPEQTLREELRRLRTSTVGRTNRFRREDLPHDVSKIVNDCISLNPEERPRNLPDIAVPLARAYGQPPPFKSKKQTIGERTRRSVIIGVMLVVAALVAFGVVALAFPPAA
ncbi:MAG: protein kinase [Anaerolineae bacterium]|nr:protein kinase [Anaerolineae bacterium]MDW8173372.1 protein kinase [Anaerolineae bacterium]